MNKIIFTFVLLASVSLFSCNETTKPAETSAKKEYKETPAFVGAWELIKMDLGGEVVKANILGDPSYSFNIDNTYVIRASSQFEQGSWSLKDGKLVLVDRETKKETTINIIENKQETLTYEIGENPVTTVYLKRSIQY